MKFLRLLSFAAVIFVTPVFAQSSEDLADAKGKAVFVFGGRYVDDYFENSFLPFIPPYENNYVLGVGYQQFFLEPLENWRIGAEVGVAARFSDVLTGEAWAGVVTRYDGWTFGDDGWRISPSLTFGLSAITDTIGAEKDRVARASGDASVLFYLSPELSLGSTKDDNEIFYRLHHRSGAWGTLGNLADGHNAHVVGFRHKF